MNDIHIPSPCRLTNTQCNFQWVSKSRVTLESYHSTLSVHDNHDRVSSLGNKTFGHLHGSLTPIQKFRISLWVSYTHKEILDITRVSYTHLEILDISTGLLHPHRNSGYLHRPLTPTQNLSDITTSLLHPNSRLFT